MSVINQVLKDLDKRGAGDNLDDPAVRVVYRVSSRDILLWMLTGAIGMLLLGGTVWMLYYEFIQRDPAPAPMLAAKSAQIAQAAPVPSTTAVNIRPQVLSVSPAYMFATGTPQKLVIHGAHLDKVTSVTLKDSQGMEYAHREILERTDATLALRINVGKTAGTWQVVLFNAGSQAGKSFTFDVKLPKEDASIKANAVMPQAVQDKPEPVMHAGSPVEGQVEKHATRMNLEQQAENEYRRSLQLQRQGQISEAMNGFENALKLDPRHESARLAMANVLIGRQQLVEAEKLLDEGLQASLKQTQLAFLLARLLVERNESGAALDILQGSQQFANNQGEYLAFHAVLLQKLQRHHEAIEFFTKALQLSPKNAVWLMGLGISLRADKQNEEARAAFRKAQDSNMLSAELRSFVAQQLKELGTAEK